MNLLLILIKNYDVLDTDSDEGNDEFSFFDPKLIDFEEDDNDTQTTNVVPVAPFQVQYNSMSNKEFCKSYTQPNKGQCHIFYFCMKYAVTCRFNERNNKWWWCWKKFSSSFDN